jgi:hypothetical protein
MVGGAGPPDREHRHPNIARKRQGLYVVGMAASIPPGWHHALQPPLTYRVGPRLYFVDRTGTPWRVRSVYIAPPDWRMVVRVPPFAREYCSRLFVDPSGKRMLYSPKYDRGAEYNPDDWSAPTLERQLGRSGAPAR